MTVKEPKTSHISIVYANHCRADGARTQPCVQHFNTLMFIFKKQHLLYY